MSCRRTVGNWVTPRHRSRGRSGGGWRDLHCGSVYVLPKPCSVRSSSRRLGPWKAHLRHCSRTDGLARRRSGASGRSSLRRRAWSGYLLGFVRRSSRTRHTSCARGTCMHNALQVLVFLWYTFLVLSLPLWRSPLVPLHQISHC